MSYQEYLSYKNAKRDLQARKRAIEVEYEDAVKRGASDKELSAIKWRLQGVQDMLNQNYPLSG